ncbi:hypothetical protein SAMN02746041_01980 [Desulfacinum hydrothermale DSM 13146]|uniref:Uncharacterized protein n=1 Tax=Desulfacinum hydrothermale DSM 13146 TaxID=1121390 RepID=A0A1W1XKC2_9BACT|nr:hypothetical protein [Desulfacinum hydrothermale]SMC24416.1 hypothetical protein SAMN02746041_01980 [Desulfacinum hydrothermale DSM 13146]
MSRWLKLVANELNEEETRRLLTEATTKLHDFLESHPEAEYRILEILDRRLSESIDGGTWETFTHLMTTYLGQDLTHFISWLALEDQEHRLAMAEQVASPDVLSFLKLLLAYHGPELEEAYVLWQQNPDDWRTMVRHVHYDQIAQRYNVKLEIEKYNGQKVVLEGPPDSLLGLAHALLVTVRMLESPEHFSDKAAQVFFEELELNRSFFAEETEETKESEDDGPGPQELH